MDGHGTAVAVEGSYELIAQEGQSSRARVVLIRPGMSANRLKWTAPVLKQAVEDGIFNGVRMFRDHNRENPTGRKTGELVSAVETSVIGGRNDKDARGNSLAGAVIGDVRFLDSSFASFAQEAREYLGTSVVVNYIGERGRDRDGPYVEPKRITKAISTDWVPFPAVQGTGILAQESFSMDWKNLSDEDIAALRKERPDLFTSHESHDTADVDVTAIAQEAAKQVAGQIKEAVAAAVKETQEQMAQESREKAATMASIDAYLKGVALPASTKARLRAQFDGAREYKEDELKVACEAATAEFDEYKKAAGITGPVLVGAGVTGTSQEGSAPVVSNGSEMAHAAVMGAFGVKAPSKNDKE